MQPLESKVMLNKIRKFLKDKERVLDTLNAILGLLMITALVVFWKTGNKISGGMVNLCNGYKYLMQKEKRTLGHSMILFGVLILVLGIIVIML